MTSEGESPTTRKLLRLANVLLADVSRHYADGSEEALRISVVELAWVVDLLLKSSVVKRDGDLLDRKRPKLFKSTPDLVDFASSVGKDFLREVGRAAQDRKRITFLLRRADEADSRGATASTFSAALSALEQASFDVDSLPSDVQRKFPTVSYPPSFLFFASLSPRQMEDFYVATKSFFGALENSGDSKKKVRPPGSDGVS